jgi:hypothetical protein
VAKTNIKKQKSHILMITASEISQYLYCPFSWLLQKSGYKPESSAIRSGEIKHNIIGNTITEINKKKVRSLFYRCVGSLLLFLGIVLIVNKVIF